MAKAFAVQDFFKRFPTDDSCLEHLMETRFGKTLDCPKCGKNGKFNRIKSIPAYGCAWCGHHIHPMAGTPFESSRTPLQKWFYAMYLFTTSRHGVPAKELQRQLSVTYKCAWRMGHEIRKYMAKVDGNTPLSGNVEADETYVGGKGKGKASRNRKHRTIMFGMLQREGNVMTQVIPNVRRKTLHALIEDNVETGSTIHTDEWIAYKGIGNKGYTHKTVNHGAGEYATPETHVNSIEGFWARLKLSIRGTHIHVSGKHLDKYAAEFEFRFNMRKCPEVMFPRLLSAF